MLRLRNRIVLLMPLVVIVLRDSKGRPPEKTDLIRILSKLEGGEGPAHFLATFHRCILVNNRSLFLPKCQSFEL